MTRKVLVIDNDAAVLDVVKEALSFENFDVRTVEYVENIFGLIDEYGPDLILVDYLLSGINGGELCYQVKCEPRTSGLPVIIFSAYPRVIEPLGTYGCDAFIEKPFDLTDLVCTIEGCIACRVS